MSSGARPARHDDVTQTATAATPVETATGATPLEPATEAEEATGAEEGGGGAEGEDNRQARAPWHFKVIAVGSVIYLGYRAYQGISWLAHHIH
jgi:hypothetical protein